MTSTTVTTGPVSHAELLRAVADLVEAHPELPTPEVDWNGNLTWYAADTAAEVAQLMRTIGGRWEKNNPKESEYHAEWATFKTDFLGRRALIIANRAAVCTRKVVGTRTVTKVVPVTTKEVAVITDIVEWECRPVLAAAAAGDPR